MTAIRSVKRSMIALAAATVGLTLAGCASNPRPSHVAQFWTQWNEDVTIVLRGEKPTIEITNNGPGAIQRLDLITADQTTSLGGIPPCGTSMFTISDGAGVKIARSSGAQATIRIWSADGFDLLSESQAPQAEVVADHGR